MKSVYKKKVSYHETDCMGIVHHSVYAKYFEDARVSFLLDTDLGDFHSPKIDYTLALLSLEIQYKKPLRLLEEFEVFLEVKLIKASRFEFTYEVYCDGLLTTTGKTLHIGLNKNLEVMKPPEGFLEAYKGMNDG